MRKTITFILPFMALAPPMLAQESGGKSSSTPIAINIPPIITKPKPIIHRAPMRIPVEVWYDPGSTPSRSIRRREQPPNTSKSNL